MRNFEGNSFYDCLYLDLHLLICLFPVGAWFCIKELNDERVFIVLYAVFSSYFAGVMIRLMLTLTPCVCVLGKRNSIEII
jgi:dolichyl-diphosphooligosaccharide--protein glycosyltransferase